MAELRVQDLIRLAADGYPLSMRLIAHPEPTLAVLVSSGTGFPKGFYERFARHLAGRGAAVLTYDYRGIAGSRPDDLAALGMDYPDWGRLDMPAALDAGEVADVQQLALDVFRVLRCSGLARVDFFFEPDGRGFLCNEVNTMPGFTPISMYPKLWQASGIPYSELIDQLVDLALERHAHRHRNTAR